MEILRKLLVCPHQFLVQFFLKEVVEKMRNRPRPMRIGGLIEKPKCQWSVAAEVEMWTSYALNGPSARI
jgi:hypothetical protein